MAQHEEKKRSGGSCGGGATKSSKKPKQKKPPQRGLGVAQLERLRLEELRKKEAPFPQSSSFCPSTSLPNFPATSEFTSCSLFSNIPSVPNMDLAAGVSNHGNYLAETRSRVADHGSNMISHFEPDHAVVGSDHPPLLSYQLEPPSNQSHHGSAAAPFSPQGEKRLGVKRSCHFALDNHPPIPRFPFKIRKVGNPIRNRPEEPPCFSRVVNLRGNFGEGPSCSSSMLGSSSTDSVRENKLNEREFLTLGPPVDNPPRSQHFASGALRQHKPRPGFDFSQYPGYPVGFVYRCAPGWTDQQMQLPFHWPYYDFLPPATPPGNIENAYNNGSSKDTSESIDLNLKL